MREAQRWRLHRMVWGLLAEVRVVGEVGLAVGNLEALAAEAAATPRLARMRPQIRAAAAALAVWVAPSAAVPCSKQGASLDPVVVLDFPTTLLPTMLTLEKAELAGGSSTSLRASSLRSRRLPRCGPTGATGLPVLAHVTAAAVAGAAAAFFFARLASPSTE